MMRACVGDWLIVEGIQVGDSRRRGQIVEVQGPNGGPPYLIHWLETGRTTLFIPGADIHIEKELSQPAYRTLFAVG